MKHIQRLILPLRTNGQSSPQTQHSRLPPPPLPHHSVPFASSPQIDTLNAQHSSNIFTFEPFMHTKHEQLLHEHDVMEHIPMDVHSGCN